MGGAVTSEGPAHAGVRVPPPFVYVAGLAIGWLLDRARPWPISRSTGSSASSLLLALAVALAVGYVIIFLSALAAFRRAHTTLIPNRPATAFVTDGPYRWTRNPMYVSLALLYLALALWMNSWWAVLMVIPVLLVINGAVIAREERYLGSAFPEQYAEYRARTRRWI